MTSTGSGADAGSSEGSSSTAAVETDCQTPREVPPPPVDCSGASGVHAGDVIIDGTAQSDDPSLLEGVVRVEGSVVIAETALTHVDFMACVREVEGGLTLFDNDQLISVDGLYSIESIGTELVFSNNDALVDFDGLPNLERAGTTVAFRSNAALETISGFHRLVEVRSEVSPCPGCPPVLAGNITIQQNPVLRTIDGLGGLRILGQLAAINNNPMMCSSSLHCVLEGIEVAPDQPTPTGMEPPPNEC
ncbi:MAG: hypothetical protein AB1Z98_15695 [Nannocystaceae bacterium]